jgi:hypothetical protein
VELERVNSERLPVLVYVVDVLSDALVSSIDDALELRPEWKPFAVRVGRLTRSSTSRALKASIPLRTISTFSSDTATPVSAAARALGATCGRLATRYHVWCHRNGACPSVVVAVTPLIIISVPLVTA